MKFVAVLLIAAMALSPATASDFSALSEPSFARGLLIPLERREELICSERWHRAGRGELKPLIGEIRDRLAIEIGSPEEAAKAFNFMDIDATHTDEESVDWPSDGATIPARCDRIAAAFVSQGAVAAMALLAPRASAPIALPSTGFCLAQLEQGLIGKDQPELVTMAQELRANASKSSALPESERAAIERDYSGFAKTTPPIANWAAIRATELADVICFPTLSSLAGRLRPDR